MIEKGFQIRDERLSEAEVWLLAVSSVLSLYLGRKGSFQKLIPFPFEQA